jgi:ABC-type glycerol-3-phosphate transport system substrate-binding protein
VPARRRLASLLAAAALLAACGSDPEPVATAEATNTTGATAPTTATSGTDETPTEVPEALDFVAPDLRGGEVVGADLAGQDVVLWFWAPW